MNVKTKIASYLKNIPGWKTKRKIIVFSVDDYGSIRLASKNARNKLFGELEPQNRFDNFDCLETREDLESLFEVLMKFEDKNGRKAVFTPFTVMRNIDFESIINNGYSEYIGENIETTFQKNESVDQEKYGSIWKLWKQGISEGCFIPQFHGREHFNVNLFSKLLAEENKNLKSMLESKSCISMGQIQGLDFTSAYNIKSQDESGYFSQLLDEGLNDFKKIFGYSAVEFMPPTSIISNGTLLGIENSDLKIIGRGLIHKIPKGDSKYNRTFNYTGKRILGKYYASVRNIVFEPNDNRGFDWSEYAMKQIEIAFTMNKPAIISSHRVNFSGGIEENNRKKGLEQLKQLLTRISGRFPDIEYLSAGELDGLILNEIEKG